MTELAQAEQILVELLTNDRHNWARIYRLMQRVEDEHLYTSGGYRSFTAWVNALASRSNVHVGLLWRRKKAGKFYEEFRQRAIAKGYEVPELESAGVSSDDLSLAEKIAGGSEAVQDELVQKVLAKDMTRKDLKEAWALAKAELSLDQVDAVAVTYGPGLVGALLVGVSFAKALAYAAEKPLIPVNHIEGHVSANYIATPDLTPPFVCLIASGGHSHIVRVEDYGKYTLLGQTMDDAAGEAFDKAARVLNLPYPGGPLLDKLSKEGNPMALKMPHVKISGRYDYSFSGLKTALINQVHALRQRGEDVPAADIAASFQHAVVELLSDKAILAATDTGARTVALAGGVASNTGLREAMEAKCARHGLRLVMPPPILCTDNAAMIGSAAFYRLMQGEVAGLDLNACPSLRLV